MSNEDLSFQTAVSAASIPAVSSVSPDDGTVAKTLQTLEQLTSVFGFDSDIASRAVDQVGPDVSLAYNWILDRGGVGT